MLSAQGQPVATWLRGRNSAQKTGMYGPDAPIFEVFNNVTQLAGGVAGQLAVTFDAGTFGSPVAFTAPENVVFAGLNPTNTSYDFLIQTNGYDPRLPAGVPTNWTALFVLARVPSLAQVQQQNPAYLQAVRDLVAAGGFNVPIVNTSQPASCYYGGPGVSPDPVRSLDVARASGLWFQHRVDVGQLRFQQGGAPACAAINFELRTDPASGMPYLADTSVQQSSAAVGVDQRVQTVTANVTVPDATNPGRLLVNFPANTLFPGQPAFGSPEWVLNTTMSADGSRYDSMTLSGGEGAYSAIFLLTRSPVLSAAEQARFTSFVQSTHFWLDVVSVQFPSQCYYGALQSLVNGKLKQIVVIEQVQLYSSCRIFLYS
jgi:lipocalin